MNLSEPALAVQDLSAGYGSVDVLRGVSITVNPGEIVALLGANGAGKTTTLLTIAGVLASRTGEIRWFGKPMSGPMHARARLGMRYVMDDRGLLRSLTVSENLRLGRVNTRDAISVFPALAALLHRRAGLLSGGEQQMLALARALCSNARLLMIDELSQGLAPIIVDELLAVLRTAADSGTAILLVEQDVAKALGIADRGYVLQRGEIALTDTAQGLNSRISQIAASYLTAGEDGSS